MVGNILKVDQGASSRYFSIYFTLCKSRDFLSDPNVQTFSLEHKARICTFTWNRPASLPKALAITLLAVGWQVEMGMVMASMGNIRHESRRPAGPFGQGSETQHT